MPMTPNERAELLAWLNSLSLEELGQIKSHVASAITFKRGAILRDLAPGSQIVFHRTGDGEQAAVGTVVKLYRVSVLVEEADGSLHKVDVDNIVGLHVGHGNVAPIGTPEHMHVTQEMPEGPAFPEDFPQYPDEEG